jgi:hypothetical protein
MKERIKDDKSRMTEKLKESRAFYDGKRINYGVK